MAKVRQLGNAPITEALIDFRVTLPPGDHTLAFRGLPDLVKNDYPNVEERRGAFFSFAVQPGQPAISSASDVGDQGYICRSADNKNVVQFRPDGLSCHRLAPYTAWNDLLRRTTLAWEIFEAVVRPTPIQLIVRNINMLRLPHDIDLDNYLSFSPNAPLGPRAFLSGFYSRVTTRDLETMVNAAIVQSSQPLADRSASNLVLDIQVTRDVQPPHTDIWATLEALHAAKNDLFFESVEELALEPYQ